MANHGDDCFFYYYSTCTKGESCPFRHCEAAMGNEIVCTLWEEGRCFRPLCKFRHMEITKNRKAIQCYWENQPTGCQKPHCAFYHEKPRHIDGVFVPPHKGVTKSKEVLHEEPAPPPPAPPAANPQLRGVMKTETHVTIPSPTHPPVVINPADDDEDEDGDLDMTDLSLNQFSEEGEDGKVGSSRKHQAVRNSGPLIFGEMGRPRGSLAERLGQRTVNNDVNMEEVPPLKRSLAERLGRVVPLEELLVPPHKAVKSIRERLDLPAEPGPHLQRADTKAPDQIHVKTLEEIRQEKATESQKQKDGLSLRNPEITLLTTKSTKPSRSIKRAITVKDSCIGQVKSFSEILHAKRKKQEQQQELPSSPKKAKTTGRAAAKSHCEASTLGPPREAADVGEVRVKTLEEIRREKAARIQDQQAVQAETRSEESGAKKNPSPLLMKKLAVRPGRVMREGKSEAKAKSANSLTDSSETSHAPTDVKVKSFEEIMREKRLRKQEMEQASSLNKDNGPAAADCPPAADVTSESGKHVSQRSPHKRPSSLVPLTPARRAQADPHSPTAEETQSAAQKSPNHTTDTKVRPKLNVKPSVHERPGQKKRGPQRSAIAAVKPLNSASSGHDESVQEPAANEGQVDFSSNPLIEQVQTAPVLKLFTSQKPKLSISVAASKETGTVPQSPGLKRCAQLKSPRPSAAGAATSPLDDFDDLINEFTEGDLEDELDPDIGEDDLLLELSEMIDS